MEKCNAFYGAIAVFTDCDVNGKTLVSEEGYTHGHTAFVYGKLQNGDYCILGGNQGDQLKVSNYDCRGKAFYSYKKTDETKIYKRFRNFYKPRGYAIKKADGLTDNYAKLSDANIKVINKAIKENKNGEKSQ